jgi:hypothetical protein
MRHSFLNISEQLGLIANLRDHSREIRKWVAEVPSERGGHSARNTARSGGRKGVDQEKEKAERLRIIPWEKSFET